jgi:hypothetical protein
LDVGEGAGQGGAEHAIRPDAEEDAGWGGAEDTARSGTGEDGETGRDAPERPAGQAEESLAPEFTRAGGEGAVVVTTAHTVPMVVVPVVEIVDAP